MTRFDFTGDTRTLGKIAADNPKIDHFHCVDTSDDREEYVFHYTVIDGRVLELPQGIDVTNEVASSWVRVVGDEIN